MKKIIISLLALCTLYGCKSNNDNPYEPPLPVKRVQSIDQDQFMTLIADYTADDWKYLGKIPAIVDFYATWCVPCQEISPILEELSEKYEGKIKIYRIDVEKEPGPANAFKVEAIPALLFIPMEGQPKMHVGVRSFNQFDALIKKELLPN